MKCLFIGGCADGQWIDVPDEYEHYRVDELRFKSKFDSWPTGPIKIEDYRRSRWMTPDEPRYIFVLIGIEKNQVLDLLLKGYKCTTSTPKNT